MFVICKKFHHKGSLMHINSIKWLIIIDDRIIHFVPSLENIFCFFLVEWYLLDSKCLWVNVWFSIRQMRQFLWWFCWQPTVYLLVNYWLSTSFLIKVFFKNFLPAGRCWKPSQCSHKVPVDFVFALATLPNKTSVNLNLIENLAYGLLIDSNLTYLHSLLLVSVFKWLITLSTW